MDGGEFLRNSHPSESLHRPFSSSQWLIGILDPVDEPSAGLLVPGHTCFHEPGVIWSKSISDADIPMAKPFHRFAEKL